MATKLAESYVEFFAKGLEETEQATQNLTDSSRKAHETVNALSVQETVLEKTTEKVIKKFEQKSRALTSASVATKQQVKDAAALEVAEKKTATKVPKKQKVEVDTGKAEGILGGFWKRISSVLGKKQEAGVVTGKAEKTLTALQKKVELLQNKKQILLIATERAEATLAAFKKKHEGRIINYTLVINTKKAEAVLAGIIKKHDDKDIKQTVVIDTKEVAAPKELPAAKEKAAAKEVAVGKKQKIDIDTSKAESGITKLKNKIKEMQMASIVAAGVLGGMVSGFANAAMEGSIEGERMSMALEKASRAIGDSFAPYVRVITEYVEELANYIRNLSAGLKSSIAVWGAVAVAAATFAAALPTIITLASGVGAAVAGAFAVMLSPIGLIVAAVAGFIAYFAGVFDTTKSWEQVLESFIGFFLDVWTQAESAFIKAWEAMKGAYDTYVTPMIDELKLAWDGAKESVLAAVTAIQETVMGFFGVANEDAGTFKGLIEGIVGAWLDLKSGAEAVIDLLTEGFVGIYTNAIKPTVDFIIDAFRLVWDYIKGLVKGLVGDWEEGGNGIMTAVKDSLAFVFSSFKNVVATIVAMWYQVAEVFATVVNKMSKLWNGMINTLAKGAAFVLEKLGIISEATAEKMRKVGTGPTEIFDVEAIRAKSAAALDKLMVKFAQNTLTAKEFAEEVANMVNAPAGPELTEKLRKNAALAKTIAGFVAGGIKKVEAQAGKGFTIKGQVAFEGLGATIDRLQLAFANAGGPNIEKAQLVQMQGINQHMQIAAGALAIIKDKIPAVR